MFTLTDAHHQAFVAGFITAPTNAPWQGLCPAICRGKGWWMGVGQTLQTQWDAFVVYKEGLKGDGCVVEWGHAACTCRTLTVTNGIG